MKDLNNSKVIVSSKNYVDSISIFKEKSEINNKEFEIKKLDKVINNRIYSDQIEIEISNLLKSIGILPHIEGYCYTIKAVRMLIDDPTLANSVTRVFYPDVADIFDSSFSKVQGAINYVVKLAFTKGMAKSRMDIFGSLLCTKDKLQPVEFLLCIAEYFRLKDKMY